MSKTHSEQISDILRPVCHDLNLSVKEYRRLHRTILDWAGAEILGGDRALWELRQMADQHKETWQDRSCWVWLGGLLEECLELGLALLGLHNKHDDPIAWELAQIGSIALNWLRHRYRLHS